MSSIGAAERSSVHPQHPAQQSELQLKQQQESLPYRNHRVDDVVVPLEKHPRERSDSQASSSSASNSSSQESSSEFSGHVSRTTAPTTEGDWQHLLGLPLQLQQQRQQQQHSVLLSHQQSHLLGAGAGTSLRTSAGTALPQGAGTLQHLAQLRSSMSSLSSSSPFSSISNQRHSSLSHSYNAATIGPAAGASTGAGAGMSYASQAHTHHGASSSSGSGHPYIGTIFGAGSMSSIVPAFQPDNNARPAYLDETGLSPDEFVQYLPALLGLKESPSGVDGLYDEQHALTYLREECGIELRDEAMILALFERTPLGIKPGHFFAWLRLASWAQQGQMPTKLLLFTQTMPVRTISMRKASGRQTARPSAMPPPPTIAVSNSLGDIRRESASAAAAFHNTPASHPHSHGPPIASPTSQSQSRFSTMPMMTSPPPPVASPPASVPTRVGTTASVRQSRAGSVIPAIVPPPPIPSANGTMHAQHPSIPTSAAAAAAQKAMPPLPPAESTKSSVNPFRDQQQNQQASQQGPPQPLSSLPPSQQYILQHAAPALPTPPPPRPPPAGKLPLDALLGFDPAPNPFKQSKPRIVRPTPVVASAAAPVPNPFRTPAPKERGDSSPRSAVSLLDGAGGGGVGLGGGSQYGGESVTGAPPAPPRLSLVDRLPPPLPPRAPISPLIQAGLNAASEKQRAKQALPPKTYTTIQRSATSATSKPSKQATPRLLTGQIAPPEVVAPLAQHAAQQQEMLYGGPAPPTKRKSIGGNSTGHGRRSVSEVATLTRRTSDEDDTKSRGGGGGGGHTRAMSSVTNRSQVRSPDQLGRRLARLANGDEDGTGDISHAASSRMPSSSNNKSSVPSWLQEQDELQRSSRGDNMPPSPIPEDLPLEFDSYNDEMSENAMSAASIERPGNPFTQRTEQPPPPVAKDRPLGRSKTLSAKNPPPAPPRKRNESFPANVAAQTEKAAFKKDVTAQQDASSNGTLKVIPPSRPNVSTTRPSPIEEDTVGEQSRRTSASTTALISPETTSDGPVSARPKSTLGRNNSFGTALRDRIEETVSSPTSSLGAGGNDDKAQNDDDDEDADTAANALRAHHQEGSGKDGAVATTDRKSSKSASAQNGGPDHHRSGYERLEE